MKICILCFDLSNNSLGRAGLLAMALASKHEVEIIGPSKSGDIWFPLQDMDIPISSLFFPKFRILMYVHVLLSTGFWLQQIVIGWYIYDQTNSPLFTTLALSVDTIPILFGGFIGGALVDRFNPKKCIIFFNR